MSTFQESTKNRILSESRRLIALHGYAAVSMLDIANAVGIRKSSIYNHFSAKHDILSKLMVDHLENAIHSAEQCLIGIATAEQKLITFTKFHIIYHVDYREDVILAYMELRSLEEGSQRSKIIKLRKNYECILRKILDDGVRQGIFDTIDIAVHSRAILAMLTGVTVWYRSDSDLSKTDIAEIYIHAVLHGVSDHKIPGYQNHNQSSWRVSKK